MAMKCVNSLIKTMRKYARKKPKCQRNDWFAIKLNCFNKIEYCLHRSIVVDRLYKSLTFYINYFDQWPQKREKKNDIRTLIFQPNQMCSIFILAQSVTNNMKICTKYQMNIDFINEAIKHNQQWNEWKQHDNMITACDNQMSGCVLAYW